MKKEILFPGKGAVGKVGQGTWRMGENPHKRKKEITALQTGIQSGLTLIDTAEMYGSGKAEEIVGEAIKSFKRKDLFLVSKVMPNRAGEKDLFGAVDETLLRLGVGELDLYLLHWRGNIPLQETVDVFEELVRMGKIKGWGVSNFDLADMRELVSLRDGGNVETNQVLYHLASRGIEYELTDFMKERNLPVMAYCPLIGQDPILKQAVLEHPAVGKIAEKHQVTKIQLLLSWVLHQENVLAIPKASSKPHVVQNAQALEIELNLEDLRALDQAFPAPDHPVPLEVR